MPPTSVSGIDVYAKKENGKFLYLRTGTPRSDTNTITVQLVPAKEYIINLSLYNGVKSVEIGIPKEKQIAATKVDKRRLEKTILFYGTSITQGGCASRPGMAFTSIVGRKLDVPVINLGFSGNGKMEMEMEELLAEQNPSVYVLDCLWNMNPKMVKERLEPFVIKLREDKPNTPIVLAEDCNFMNVSPTEKGKIVRAIYKKLVDNGMEQLYFLSNEGMLGTDGEATVDGTHPSDLGMVRMSVVFTDYLKEFIK
jgi:lysophospholipase L1-like esterase